MREIHISKADLRIVRAVDVRSPPLADSAARLRLDLFALTSNNITYAAMGSGALGYWDFFPGPEGWGRPPVWGFGSVVRSNAPGIDEGARYWGFYPLGETFDVTPTAIRPGRFIDGAPHREGKAAVYNFYLNTAADPDYDPAFEPEQTLFRPLYATGWWAADCVHQDGPSMVVISSASSKTAIATAHQLRRLSGAEIVALTSARNEAYVRDTHLYSRTFTYDAIESLPAEAPATYLDFLARDSVTAAVHGALGAQLQRSLLIGATDWADKPGGVQPPSTALAAPAPEFFFVPTYAAARATADPELGGALRRDLRAFYAASRAFVAARRLVGADSIIESWARVAAGETPPREGLVLSF